MDVLKLCHEVPVQLHSGSWEDADHECATYVTSASIPVIFIEKNVKKCKIFGKESERSRKR